MAAASSFLGWCLLPSGREEWITHCLGLLDGPAFSTGHFQKLSELGAGKIPEGVRHSSRTRVDGYKGGLEDVLLASGEGSLPAVGPFFLPSDRRWLDSGLMLETLFFPLGCTLEAPAVGKAKAGGDLKRLPATLGLTDLPTH